MHLYFEQFEFFQKCMPSCAKSLDEYLQPYQTYFDSKSMEIIVKEYFGTISSYLKFL